MRKLTKQPLPEPIASQIEEWDRELRTALATGQTINVTLQRRYREPSLKTEIVKETNGKCAYCESFVTPVYAGDVEHILPKTHRPELRLNYENLTFACWQCNHRKLDYYDPILPLLNPYLDDPDAHLLPIGPLIFHATNDRRGEVTRLLLELDRDELVERRIDRLEKLHSLAEKYNREPPGVLRQLLEEQLKKEADKTAEYTFVVRGYLRNVCGIVV